MRDHLQRHPGPATCASSGISRSAARWASRRRTRRPRAAPTPTLAERVERFERDLIRDELIVAGGDVRLAAEALGAPRKTLYDKIARYGLVPTDYR